MIDHVQNANIMRTLRAKHVAAPHDAKFATHLERLLCRGEQGNLTAEAIRFGATQETRGILVIDGPGGGKSTMVARSLSRHPALQQGQYGHAAWLGVSVPSPATLKSLGFEILRRSGYPEVSERRQVWHVWDQIRSRLKMLGVSVLWIDEAHDLFCKDREMILRALKALMQGDEAVIAILSGTERLREVIQSDQQVLRRFSAINLSPVGVATDGQDFHELIERYCGLAALRPELSGDLVSRLFHGSRYRFGRSIETMLNAIEVALESGADCVCDDHFARAWAMQEGCAPGGNVFLTEDWTDIGLDVDGEQQSFQRRVRR